MSTAHFTRTGGEGKSAAYGKPSTGRGHAGVFRAMLAAGLVSCGSPVPSTPVTNRLAITVTSSVLGTPDGPLPVAGMRERPFTAAVTAYDLRGDVDEDFTGWARISVKPGAVISLGGAAEVRGRSVHLVRGRAEGITVGIEGAFGETRLWAEDAGYDPVDPTRDPPPACANGVDDDSDGTVDFPADPGCAFANDDTEGAGSRSAGASQAIHFALPRVADVRGVSLGGAATAYPKQQVLVDTGWRAEFRDPATGSPAPKFVHQVVVTRIASDGFYVTDIDDPRGYGSVFAFTFGSPPGLRVCDRLYSLAGTAVDFYGFTELGFPTFSAEYWVPKVHADGSANPLGRDCLVPEPYSFSADDLGASSAPVRFRHESALVRVESSGSNVLRVGAYLGRDRPGPPEYKPSAGATNCDLNGDGTVDYYTEPEKTCSAACESDADCTEYTNFRLRRTYQLVLVPGGDEKKRQAIQGDSTTASAFDPLLHKGRPLRSFSGTLRYFSGGARFTIESRCRDDVVVSMSDSPRSSSVACVMPRTETDNDENSH